MDRASALPFPSSRTLAGWWRQLQPHAPRGLWVGHAYLHRIEAPVRTVRRRPLDPLAAQLLRALTLAPAASSCPRPECVQALEGRLHLPAAILRHHLRDLAQDGLVAWTADRGWSLTPAGHDALDHGEHRHQTEERRVFPFV